MVEKLKFLKTLETESDGEWLLVARRRLGLTQSQLATLVGYSTHWISKIEKDEQSLPPAVRNKVLKMLQAKGGVR